MSDFITYECPQCENATRYQVDLNLPDKDMNCPRCGHEIRRGELPGGGEWVGVDVDVGSATGSGGAFNPTVLATENPSEPWEDLSPR